MKWWLKLDKIQVIILVCQFYFIKKELTNRIIDADESHLKYALFDHISIKGSALFKNVHSKLDQAFGKLDLDENLRNETKYKIRAKRNI